MKPRILGALLFSLWASAGAAYADSLLINGAGATFPFPLYSKWFSEYHQRHPDLKFNYQSIGSGAGIKQVTERTVDFGATDAPMTDTELGRAPGVLHLPMALGADAVSYNLPGVQSGLKLTPDVLADIFLGKITRWSDARLTAPNPGTKLPDLPIVVIHRSDGSGTTAIFTDYLAKVSPEWKARVGVGKSVRWPAGLGGKGNEGVTGLIRSTPGAIGYLELAYATQNKLPVVALRNRAGNFVSPTIAATSAAATGVSLPDDYRVSITDPAGKDAYPIAAFTYLLVYREQSDARKGAALAEFLWWAIHDGQKLAPPLEYAPLPPNVVTRLESTVRSISSQGKSLLAGAR